MASESDFNTLHPNDSRVKFEDDGKIQALTSRAGSGGGNTPMVLNIRQMAMTVGENIANTLTQTDYKSTQCVCETKAYGICSDKSNSMLSSNSKSGIYEAETSRTLDQTCVNPSANQGGIAIVESYSLQSTIIGRADKNGPNGSGINQDVSFTLDTTSPHGVVYSLDRASFNQGKNAQFDISISDDGTAQTVVAKGPNAVAIEATYVIRRLSILECCRLQGYPDFWCADLETTNPTEEDIAFWRDVFETNRLIAKTSTRPKSRN